MWTLSAAPRTSSVARLAATAALLFAAVAPVASSAAERPAPPRAGRLPVSVVEATIPELRAALERGETTSRSSWCGNT